MVLHGWQQVPFAYSFSDRLCGMLPDRGHKFHSAPTAGPGGDPARSSPPPPGLMSPEPCHCCEKADRRPINPDGRKFISGLSDRQPNARNSGRLKKRGENRQPTHSTSNHPPCTGCTLRATTSAHVQADAAHRGLILQTDPLPCPQARWEKGEFNFIHVLLSQLNIADNTSKWCIQI